MVRTEETLFFAFYINVLNGDEADRLKACAVDSRL